MEKISSSQLVKLQFWHQLEHSPVYILGPTMLELRLLLCEDKFNESNVSHASACVWSLILGWVDAFGTIKPDPSSRSRELRLEVGTYHWLAEFCRKPRSDSERVFVE